MALAQQVSVTPAGVTIAGPTVSGGPRLRIRNSQTTVSVYVHGDENTAYSSTNGMTLGPQQAVDIVVNMAKEQVILYASLTVTVEVFRSGGTVAG